MDIKENVSLKRDEENSESNLSIFQYSDVDSILPCSTDSEEERDLTKSFEQKKFTSVKRKYSDFNQELIVERSLQGRKIIKIGGEWFSHPMYDNRSSPENSDDERSMNNKDISYKECKRRKKILKDQLSNCSDERSSIETSEESEQFDELYPAKEVVEIRSKPLQNFVTKITSDEESDQIDELKQERIL
ncbi:hypothetical protein C1645_823356 [Glomus cerebriforme]|uniref:Uncharacterized protein n=1 Tax=Glomus cerebriforme TaxID=658196 RepID=A0A397T5Y0_9GLOM|nr:hypothetical protein C1645_823356 [Glomus cerebriforme]